VARIPADLFGSELFRLRESAFTGAKKDKVVIELGRWRHFIFLDEIGENAAGDAGPNAFVYYKKTFFRLAEREHKTHRIFVSPANERGFTGKSREAVFGEDFVLSNQRRETLKRKSPCLNV